MVNVYTSTRQQYSDCVILMLAIEYIMYTKFRFTNCTKKGTTVTYVVCPL